MNYKNKENYKKDEPKKSEFFVVWYVRQHITIIISFIIFSVIFTVIFSLYRLETEAVLYAAALCVLTSVLLSPVFILRYYKKHKTLRNIKKNILIHSDKLPSPESITEIDYQEIVKELIRINNDNLTEWSLQRTESMDYYTAWVHQIKTPISVMRMLLQSEDTEENKALLAELFRIERYVEMVLCRYRLDSVSNDFVFKWYKLDKIIRHSVHRYAAQFIHKKIQFSYSGTDITVLTDEKWLCFIIEQILSNAIKYTEKGIITISAGENKILCISDTGIGIEREDLPRIFEKGFTGCNGRTDKKSTGLGLYLCKLAADKLSHSITVNSEKNRGTTVYIDLDTVKLETE